MRRPRRRAREKQLRHGRAFAASSGLAVAATLATGGLAHAATYQVDTNSGSDNASFAACTSADNDCSLAGAITKANTDPGSTITFASTVTGSITPTNGIPPISHGETIEGPGAGVLTVDLSTSYMYGYDYVHTSDGDVTISGLTLDLGHATRISSTGSGALHLS